MLRSFKALKGYSLQAADGDIGRVDDIYFDDRTWKISHLVIQTGTRFTSRKVLLSSYTLGIVDRRANTIVTSMTRAQVQRAPSHSQAMPVSQQRENVVIANCGWGAGEPSPASWITLGGLSMEEAEVTRENNSSLDATPVEATPFDSLLTSPSDEAHRRSASEVHHYAIATQDGLLGHVTDFLVDDEQAPWTIRHLVVRTGSWPTSRKVLLAPYCVEAIDWERAQVQVCLSREELRGCPSFDASTPIARRAPQDKHFGLGMKPQAEG